MNDLIFNKLPNLLIIGSPKCGTTSLHSILGQHPEIYVTPAKEAHFFDRDVYNNGLQWYLENYFKDAEGFTIRCESTPFYLTFGKVVAPRIKESYGNHNLKFVAIFRDPVKRAYSHYWFSKRRFREVESFKGALESEWRGERNERTSIYYPGCYATLLQSYFKYFARENFHFLTLEDLRSDFNNTMNKLNEFLGFSGDFEYKSEIRNQSTGIKNKHLFKILRNPSDPIHKIGKFIKNMFPQEQANRFGQKFFNANLKQETTPPMDKDIEAILRSRYKEEILKLEAIMGRDLSSWYVQ
jgi:hypothetical protein